MNQINTVIVGQGIAGSMIAFMLHQQQVPFVVIDAGIANTSSRIAAGMFSPISGKRKTIHAITLQQIPFAIEMYKAVELLLGIDFLHTNPVYQVFNSLADQQEVLAKYRDIDFANYIQPNPAILPNIKQPNGACEISASGWVDCGLLISRFAEWLLQRNALVQTDFIYEDLNISKGIMEYHGLKFENIVFCEGYRAINNPFFKEKIIPCKGDLLTIQYDHLSTDRIIKKGSIYSIDTGHHVFKAGATYQWNNSNEVPEEAGKKMIELQLDDMLDKEYRVLNHQSAIRPTTQNREVIAKQHPDYAGMFMLNGLGTKGILQGPWWARHLINIILKSK